MIQLILLLIVIIAFWLLFRMISKTIAMNQTATLDEARTLGLHEASAHITNPILLEDYSTAKGVPLDILISLVQEGKIPFYQWRQYTFVENRDLVMAKK
jgi:hypothetical protein